MAEYNGKKFYSIDCTDLDYRSTIKLTCKGCGIPGGGTKAYATSDLSEALCYCCWRNLLDVKPLKDPSTCNCCQHFFQRNKDHPNAFVFV